jgi:hypothetical protein
MFLYYERESINGKALVTPLNAKFSGLKINPSIVFALVKHHK